MNDLQASPVSTIAESVLELADSFGVYATFFAKAVEDRQYAWHSGRFVQRHNRETKKMLLHLLLPDGRVGRACTEEWTIQAAERAFHDARQHADEMPGFRDILHQLELAEQRAPVLPWEVETPVWEEMKAAMMIEKHHHDLCASLPADVLDTIFRVSLERSYSLRSDGISHLAAVWRGACTHRLFDPERLQTETIHHGISMTEHSPFPIDVLILTLTESIKQRRKHSGFDQRSHLSRKRSVQDLPLLVDTGILARMVHAWLQTTTHQQYAASAVTLMLEPLEGAYGYTPLHPYGYLLSPTVLLSKDGMNRAMLQALRMPPMQTGHLTCLPAELDSRPITTPIQACRTLEQYGLLEEEVLYVCEGVERFHFNPATAAFSLLPKHVTRCGIDRILEKENPCWLVGSLDELFSSIIAGMGSMQIACADMDHMWSLAGPAYTFLRYR
jgi:hypothetical protein